MWESKGEMLGEKEVIVTAQANELTFYHTKQDRVFSVMPLCLYVLGYDKWMCFARS